MALNKKGGFGIDLEEQFKNVESVDSIASTLTSTPTPTQTYTPASTPTPIKENRSKRTYINTKPSVFKKLDDYSGMTGRSINDLVNEAIDDFIVKNGL